MNWYIGQKIIAIKSHLDGFFKSGDEFIINGLRNSVCKCGSIEIFVGIYADENKFSNNSLCSKCGIIYKESNNAVWNKETYFAPLADISELEEILKQKEEA